MELSTKPQRAARDASKHSRPTPDGPFPSDFGRYRLLGYLGGGGMGAVYLADDLKLEIKVALKIPHPDLLAKPTLLERFYREARAAARLDHPGLCWVLDVGEIGGTPYFVMRYIAGKPLSSCPPPAPRAAAILVRSVALAMAAAHRLGVIHRDLKPANIVVTPGGEPVVADFGIALVLDPEAQRMTDAGAMMGTLPYMSPEQLRGDPEAIGPPSDVYSLGVVLYELLAGNLPYKNPIVEVLLEPSRHPAAAPPSAHKPGGDAALDAICLKALAREIHERYSGMDEFAAALTAYLSVVPPATGHNGAIGARARRAPRGGPAPCSTVKRSGLRSSAMASRRRPADRRRAASTSTWATTAGWASSTTTRSNRLTMEVRPGWSLPTPS